MVVVLIFAAGLAGGAVAGGAEAVGAVAGGFCGITTEVAIGALRSNSGSAVAYDACTNGGSAPSVKKNRNTLRTTLTLIHVKNELLEQNTISTHLSKS